MTGRLDILQWAIANGCPWDHRTWNVAAEFSCVKVLQWAAAMGYYEPT
jgi:hypothetical protein